MTRSQPISPDLENWQRHCRMMRNLCRHHPWPLEVDSLHGIKREQIAQFSEGVSKGTVLRHNYPAIPAVDPVFLPREVDPTYTTITNIGRDASR
jgi:hypothetical protein